MSDQGVIQLVAESLLPLMPLPHLLAIGLEDIKVIQTRDTDRAESTAHHDAGAQMPQKSPGGAQMAESRVRALVDKACNREPDSRKKSPYPDRKPPDRREVRKEIAFAGINRSHGGIGWVLRINRSSCPISQATEPCLRMGYPGLRDHHDPPTGQTDSPA